MCSIYKIYPRSSASGPISCWTSVACCINRVRPLTFKTNMREARMVFGSNSKPQRALGAAPWLREAVKPCGVRRAVSAGRPEPGPLEQRKERKPAVWLEWCRVRRGCWKMGQWSKSQQHWEETRVQTRARRTKKQGGGNGV